MGANLEKKPETSKSFEGKILKRNKLKYFGYHLAGMLFYGNPTSSLLKSYQNSFYCCNGIEVTADGMAISMNCKNRWCPICQRNKMGMMINAYADRLKLEKELWFITLTRPNVTAEELKKEISRYQELWRQIANTSEYRKAMKQGVIGIRKIECTFHGKQFLKDGSPDPLFNTYHPHFHLLVSSEELAKFILFQWLLLNPCSNEKAQKCEKVNSDGGILEIFKYFTKLIAKDSSGKRFFDAVHMDVIFRSLHGRKVYFRLGQGKVWGVAEVTEEDEDQVATIETEASVGYYQWVECDDFFGYYDVDTGETLTELPKKGRLFDIIAESEKRLGMPPQTTDKM